ncbi:hypothetical protein [Spiroplasma sp. DGKH1]|uniref:hypothetical protein n=1 Tax=Spiroplasma sp. DGKH1 TaxID=3050074 RepID=UPI0034C61826
MAVNVKGNIKTDTTIKNRVKLLDKRVNSFTVEKLLRHSNSGKVKPANKMIEQYYLRREQEALEARKKREKAAKGGIYNLSLAKYDNIFAETKRKLEDHQKVMRINPRLNPGKKITYDRFAKENLEKLTLKKSPSKSLNQQDVIDIHDLNANMEKPTITYDSQKGIYVMQDSQAAKKTVASSPVVEANDNQPVSVRVQQPSATVTTKASRYAPRRTYSSTVIVDPAKRPSFLAEIPTPDDRPVKVQASTTPKSSSTGKENKTAKPAPERFSKTKFLQELNNNNKDNSTLTTTNSFDYEYHRSRKTARDFFYNIFDKIGFTKLVNYSKKWNK